MVLMLFCMTIGNIFPRRQLTPIGFGVIRASQNYYQDDLVKKVIEITASEKTAQSPEDIVNAAHQAIADTPKTWKQRLFSLKGLHGLLMTIAWVTLQTNI